MMNDDEYEARRINAEPWEPLAWDAEAAVPEVPLLLRHEGRACRADGHLPELRASSAVPGRHTPRRRQVRYCREHGHIFMGSNRTERTEEKDGSDEKGKHFGRKASAHEFPAPRAMSVQGSHERLAATARGLDPDPDRYR